MKNSVTFRLIRLLFFLMPLSAFAQWAYHTSFPSYIYPQYSGTFKDAVYISEDTGFCCLDEYIPNSLASNAYLLRSFDDFETYQFALQSGGYGNSAYAVRYFQPYVYYLHNSEGLLSIHYGHNGLNLSILWMVMGFYNDFFANSPEDFKIILDDGKFIHRLNGTTVISQYFSDFVLNKMYFPIDTVGIFIARRPGSDDHTLIVKYTPTLGFNIVYENQTINLNCLEFSDGLTGFAGGNSGLVMRSDDLGNTWQTLTTNSTSNVNSIEFVDDNTGYAVGNGQTILKTEDHGNSWFLQSPPVSGAYTKVFFVSHEVGYILCGQKLLKTTNGGVTWITDKSLSDNQLSISPNPGTEFFKVEFPGDFDPAAQIELSLFDFAGKTVFSQNSKLTDRTIELNLKGLPSGIYQVLIFSDKTSYHTKLVKK